MKRILLSLLAAILTVTILCVGAYAEDDVDACYEPEVAELEEFELGEFPEYDTGDGLLNNLEDETEEVSLGEVTEEYDSQVWESNKEVVYDAFDEGIIVPEYVYLAGSNASDFEIDEDGVLVAYHGQGGAVTIPNTVKEIGEFVFNTYGPVDEDGGQELLDNTTVTSVVIPSSVTRIRECAFHSCIKLTSVSIPNSVRWIDQYAFANCSSLAAVNVPDSVEAIGEGAFAFCAKLKTVKLPSALTEIPKSLFDECTSLKSVSIPSTVKRIGWNAFWGCSSLSSITIPNGVTEICGGAFINCSQLSYISIPGTVKTFSVTYTDEDSGETKFESIFWQSGLVTAVIQSGVTQIPTSLFYDCSKLKSVSIPNTVTSINDYAFANCTSLANISIPNTVTSIGSNAFMNRAASLNIITSCNSAAYKYAKANGIAFTATGHTNAVMAAVEATCIKTGLTQGVKCSVCGEILTAQKTVPVVSSRHTNLVPLPAVAATCTNTGLTVGVKCNDCNTITVAQSIVPVKGHTPVSVSGYPATYTSAGLTDGSKCSVCGDWITTQQVIPQLEYPTRILDKNKNNGKLVMNLGDHVRLVPQFASNAGVNVTGYKSGKAKCATIDGSSLITAVAEGKAKITVTTNNKKQKATITVQVVDPYKPTGITINQGKMVRLAIGQPMQLGATLAPSTARATLTWKSSKTKVATVDDNGWVTPLKEGKAKITVTTHNKKKAKITVQVYDPYKPLGVSINQGKTVTLKVGQTLQLGTSLNPITARSALTWKSSKAAIVTVNGDGLVTAVKKGKAKITVTTYNKKKATITVNVIE